jgi:hypothetical protein
VFWINKNPSLMASKFNSANESLQNSKLEQYIKQNKKYKFPEMPQP